MSIELKKELESMRFSESPETPDFSQKSKLALFTEANPNVA